ncbi:MAG: hypothetical protein HY708_06440 [Ignavibacteriae bacterium]|nr:hypothetical protein [Ignavibacteriota bacterium]
MTHTFTLALTFWVGFTLTAGAQQVTFQINVVSPMPGHLSEWQSNPSLITAIVVNNSPQALQNVGIAFTLRDLSNGALVARSRDQHPSLPRVTFPPGQSTFQGPSLFNPSAVDVFEPYRGLATTIGSLPEGQYEFCVRLLDALGGQIAATGRLCANCTVLLPNPPSLISPQQNDSLRAGLLPTFVWTPVQIASIPVFYTLRIAPLFAGQTDLTAIESNPTLFTARIANTTYQYLPSDPPFTLYPDARAYVWRVQSTDERGIPIGNNEGKSETNKFKVPTTGDCNCTIGHEWVGGPPIKILKQLAAYSAQDSNQGLAVAMSVLAEDVDVLIQKCVLNGVREKKITDIGNPVSYTWKVEEGDSGSLLGAGASTAVYVLPHSIRDGETKTYRIKCTLSSAYDDPTEGSVTITVNGRDTCETYEVRTSITPITEKSPKDRPISEQGNCFPAAEEWKRAGAITKTLQMPANVQVSQITHLQVDAKDPDQLHLKCTSEGCGNPEKDVDLDEPFIYKWSDGGAGGKFPLGDNGSAVAYIAPGTPREVTITCEIKDNGTHRAASGEATTINGKLRVHDVLTELNLKDATKDKDFFTVGHNSTLEPTWIRTPRIQVLKADWCLDLGGETGHVEATAEKGSGLSQSEASLRFAEGSNRDYDLVVHWNNHSHIHNKYSLSHRLTFRFTGEKIIYQDSDWSKSDFMDGAKKNEYKLFFEKETKQDDGKWRTNAVQSHDAFGRAPSINSTEATNWFVHWAKNTYDPCTRGYNLTSTDPTFEFVDAISGAFADYFHNERNVVRITKKSAETANMTGYRRSGRVISSDKKHVEFAINLPAYNLKGVKLMNKIANHELAHWESMTANWRTGAAWESLYGPRRTEKHLIREFEGKSSSAVTIRSASVTERGDAVDKHSATITVETDNGTVLTVVVNRGWLDDGAFNKNFTFVTERNGLESFTERLGERTTTYSTKNGIIIERSGSLRFKVYERPNDPDDDSVPNVVEDSIGTSWIHFTTHPGFYHPLKNDREFYAEWRTRDIVSPDCKTEKDWSNPGLQTGE